MLPILLHVLEYPVSVQHPPSLAECRDPCIERDNVWCQPLHTHPFHQPLSLLHQALLAEPCDHRVANHQVHARHSVEYLKSINAPPRTAVPSRQDPKTELIPGGHCVKHPLGELHAAGVTERLEQEVASEDVRLGAGEEQVLVERLDKVEAGLAERGENEAVVDGGGRRRRGRERAEGAEGGDGEAQREDVGAGEEREEVGGGIREGEDVAVEEREERVGGGVFGDEAGEERRGARRRRAGRGGKVEEESERDGRGGGVAAEEREQVGGGRGGGHGRVAAGGGAQRPIGLNRPGLAARWGQPPGPLTLPGGAGMLVICSEFFFFLPSRFRLVFIYRLLVFNQTDEDVQVFTSTPHSNAKLPIPSRDSHENSGGSKNIEDGSIGCILPPSKLLFCCFRFFFLVYYGRISINLYCV